MCEINTSKMFSWSRKEKRYENYIKSKTYLQFVVKRLCCHNFLVDQLNLLKWRVWRASESANAKYKRNLLKSKIE